MHSEPSFIMSIHSSKH